MQVANNSNDPKQAMQQPTTNTQYTSQGTPQHSSNIISPQRQQYQRPTSPTTYATQQQNHQQQYQQPHNIYPQQAQQYGHVNINCRMPNNGYPQHINTSGNSVAPSSAPNDSKNKMMVINMP